MSSIPLVALSVRPQSFQDPIANQGLLMQLKQLGQETQQQAALAPGQQQRLQLGQQAIQQGQYAEQDRAAGMKAMQEWSGKDVSELPDLIQKNGGSLQAVLGAKKNIIESQQQVMNLNTAQLAQNKTKSDYLLGKLQAASGKDIPDDQLGQSVMSATQEAIKDGYLDPQHAQEVQQMIQGYPNPADLRNHLSIYEKGLMSQSEQFSQEQKNRETTAQEQQAQARVATAQTSAARLQAEGPGGALQAPDKAEMQDWLSKNPGKGPADFLKYKASLAPQASVAAQSGGPLSDTIIDALAAPGAKLKLSDVLPPRAPEQVRQAALNQILAKHPEYSTSDYAVSQKVAEKYTSGNVADQLLAIGTAREHMKTFASLADALNNGDTQKLNQIGNEIGLQFGDDKKSNFNIAAQAFGGEVGKAFDGAGVVAGERAEAQKNFNDAMSRGQFKGAIQTVDSLLAGKQKAAQDAYKQGRKGTPNFGGGAQGGGPASQAGAPATSGTDPFAQFGGQKH